MMTEGTVQKRIYIAGVFLTVPQNMMEKAKLHQKRSLKKLITCVRPSPLLNESNIDFVSLCPHCTILSAFLPSNPMPLLSFLSVHPAISPQIDTSQQHAAALNDAILHSAAKGFFSLVIEVGFFRRVVRWIKAAFLLELPFS
ncbi:MAG: hypothetical protein GKS05_07835 [Nitrospirales bacterium]|nr:hypothetical protein [Nitrospirales bacterium]